MNGALGNRTIQAFSLVEVVIAIGIVSFGLVAIFGLQPTGLVALKEGRAQEEATDYLALVAAEMQASKSKQDLSPILGLNATSTANQTLVLDRFGSITSSNSANATYVLSVEPITNSALPGTAFYISVSWPAQSAKTGSRVETLVALPAQTTGVNP